MLWRLKVSEAAVKTAISRTPTDRARSRPLRFGTSAGYRTPLDRWIFRNTSSVSASWGMARADTKEPTSMAGSPAEVRRSMNPTRTSGGTVAASFCSPSRGPTSYTVTRCGRWGRWMACSSQPSMEANVISDGTAILGGTAGAGRRSRASLHLRENRSGLDQIPFPRRDGADDAVPRRAKGVLHFHRLQNENDLAPRDRRA